VHGKSPAAHDICWCNSILGTRVPSSAQLPLEALCRVVYGAAVLRKTFFIEPAHAILKPRPPKGDGWLSEINFDGCRTQLHSGTARLLSFPRTAPASRRGFLASPQRLPSCRSRAIIDGEVVACDAAGAPDFRALHGGNYAQTDLCSWCFDLLETTARTSARCR
jgi:ATP-dependent DNA ligase